MATVDELLIRLDASTESLRRELVKADKAVEKTAKVTDREVGKIDAVFGKMGRTGAKAARALGVAGAAIGAVGVAAGGAYYGIKQASQVLTELSDAAEQAGVGLNTFQEFTYAAGQTGVSLDALTDGLKELNLRLDEFVTTGQGPAAEAFQRLGFGQNELAGYIGETDRLMMDLIRRMEGLDEAAKIRIADEIFGGTGGEQFVRLVNQGADALTGMRREAHELGLVVDKDLIEKATEANRKMEAFERIISVNLSAALVDILPTIESVAGGVAEVAKAAGRVIDLFRDTENESTYGLERKAAGLLEDYDTKMRQIDAKRQEGMAERLLFPLKVEAEAIREEYDKINAILDARKSEPLVIGDIKPGGVNPPGRGAPVPDTKTTKTAADEFRSVLYDVDQILAEQEKAGQQIVADLERQAKVARLVASGQKEAAQWAREEAQWREVLGESYDKMEPAIRKAWEALQEVNKQTEQQAKAMQYVEDIGARGADEFPADAINDPATTMAVTEALS